MKPRVLLVLDGDPRTSPRPAEGLRVAAGLAAWLNTGLWLYLHGPAVALLDDEAYEWVGGSEVPRWLDQIAAPGHPVLVDGEAPELAAIRRSGVPHRRLTCTELGSLAAGAKYTLRFT
jgi:hypothetical protein